MSVAMSIESFVPCAAASASIRDTEDHRALFRMLQFALCKSCSPRSNFLPSGSMRCTVNDASKRLVGSDAILMDSIRRSVLVRDCLQAEFLGDSLEGKDADFGQADQVGGEVDSDFLKPCSPFGSLHQKVDRVELDHFEMVVCLITNLLLSSEYRNSQLSAAPQTQTKQLWNHKNERSQARWPVTFQYRLGPLLPLRPHNKTVPMKQKLDFSQAGSTPSSQRTVTIQVP